MYDELSDFFAKRLVELRMSKNLSARDMSLSLGLNPGYINRIENKKAFPTMENFFYICEYLEVSPNEFFEKDNINFNSALIKELNEYSNSLNEEQLKHILALVRYIKDLNDLEDLKSNKK